MIALFEDVAANRFVKKSKTRFRFKKTITRFFAAVMFLTCLGNTFPLVAAASLWRNDSCQMECCQGQPYHSSNSCHHGGIHRLKAALNQNLKETFCGAHESAEKHLAVAQKKNVFTAAKTIGVPIYDASRETESPADGLPRLQPVPSDNPCQTAVCAGSSGCSSLGQQKQSRANGRNAPANAAAAALAPFAARPRPPSFSLFKRYFQSSAFAPVVIARCLPLRAPPVSL